VGDGDRFPHAEFGQKCDDKRQEFILFSDVMGVSMLVDALNHRLEGRATPTPSKVRSMCDGRLFARRRQYGGGVPGIPCFVTGTVKGLDGKPAVNARLDLWQTDGEGSTRPSATSPSRGCAACFTPRPMAPTRSARSAPIGYSNPDGRTDRRISSSGTDVSEMRRPTFTFVSRRPVITVWSRICSSADARIWKQMWSMA